MKTFLGLVCLVLLMTSCSGADECDLSVYDKFCPNLTATCDGQYMDMDCHDPEGINGQCRIACVIYCHYWGAQAHTGKCTPGALKDVQVCECR
jgi:hypothetical protein